MDAGNIWQILELLGEFSSETKADNKFRLWIEGDALKIAIQQPSGIRTKSVSRSRFEKWCKLWFELGVVSSTAYCNETGRSLAKNFTYVAYYFKWVDSAKG